MGTPIEEVVQPKSETIEITPKQSGFTPALSKDEYERRKNAYKSRHAQVTYRAGYSTHLHVDVPSHIHYEWVKNAQYDIDEMQRKGFIIDTEYACMSNIHGEKKTGKPTIVQDVICMITPIENKAALDELTREEYVRRHGKPDRSGLVRGRDEDKSANVGIDPIPNDLGLIEESTTRQIGGAELMSHLKEKTT